MDDTPIPTLAEKIRAVPNGYRLTPAAFFAFDVALRAAAALVEVEAAKTQIGSVHSVDASVVPLPLVSLESMWISVEDQRPPSGDETYLVANAKGQVAPHIRGVIHNNVGSHWDWNYGEAVTHWMPLPAAPLGVAG